MDVRCDLLTLMVTPAVLISACGLMILSTTNRYARVIDRIRQVDHLLDQLCTSAVSDERAARLTHARRQITLLRRRGRALRNAMMFLVGGVAGFIAASISTVIAFAWLDGGMAVPLTLVVLGMVSFLAGAVCLMFEVADSFRVTEEDLALTEELQRHMTALAPTSPRPNFGE